MPIPQSGEEPVSSMPNPPTEESDDDQSTESYVPDRRDTCTSDGEWTPLTDGRRHPSPSPTLTIPTEKGQGQEPVSYLPNPSSVSETESFEDPVSSSCPDKKFLSDIVVQVTNNHYLGRKFDKRFPCVYCQTLQTQIQRHLRDCHPNEPEVIEITNERDKNKKSRLMELIRNRGVHMHNCRVVREGKGLFIVTYRPTYEANYEDYRPCCHCLGYYVKSDLWKHLCHHKPTNLPKGTSQPAMSAKLMMPGPSTGTISAGLHKVTKHDIRVHREFYRLPNDVIEVAKVSKLHLAMEKGRSDLTQGGNLDNIKVADVGLSESEDEEETVVPQLPDRQRKRHLSEDLSESSDGEENVSPQLPDRQRKRHLSEGLSRARIGDAVLATSRTNRKKKNRKQIHVPWSQSEKQAVLKHFEQVVLMNKLPGKQAIEECLKEEHVLHKRSWKNVKDFLRNASKMKKTVI